jgi:transposase InsO family protein
VSAELLDQGIYLASVPTMYRLRAHDEVHELRRQATHPAPKKPELLATKPNEVYSWDITKLLGPQKWTCYYLYVILDIYSRYVPGWMLAHVENARLAEALLADSVAKHNIERHQLTIHADRGSPMTAKPVAFCWPISVSPRPRAARTRATTTPTAKASSAPSSTGLSSLTGSAASRTPTLTAAGGQGVGGTSSAQRWTRGAQPGEEDL